MDSDKPQFFTRRSFLCPLCQAEVLIGNEAEFLDHAKRYHPDSTDDAPEGPRWKEILNAAASRARQKVARKLAPDPAPELSKRSSTDSMKPYVGDAASHSTHSRPVSGLGTKQTEPNPEDIERLNLGQAIGRETHSGTPGLIPLKRPANQYTSPEVKVSGEERGKKGRVKGEITTDLSRASKSGSGKRAYDPVSDSLSANRGHFTPAPVALQGRGLKPHSQDTLEQGSFKQRISTVSPKGRSHAEAVATSRNFDYNNFNRVDFNLEQAEPIDQWDADPELLLQPETRPISHDQLVHEVKGIYAGLVMVEAKCIDVDGKQTAAARERESAKKTQLTPEQWSALIALHKTLLHEHHDFFLASQHPSASPALTKLAEKYSMPARMWKHGIHAFLEVLRLRLPGSLDHMLAFIYIAYSMMALLYETVPSFENTWIECLGDLGRYRMAIGDEDVKDREVWSGVAKFWYEKAAEKNPQIGRLHHHLAILARPYTVQQLSLYTRALTAVVPFDGAKTSLRTLISPVFSGQELASFKPASVEAMLTKCIAFLSTGRSGEPYDTCVHQLVSASFNRYIERLGSRFKEIGVFAFHCASGALLEFGSSQPKGGSRALIRRAFDDLLRQRLAQQDDVTADSTVMPASPVSPTLELTIHEIEESKSNIAEASKLFFGLLSVALQRPQDKNVQPMVHSYLALIKNLAASDSAMQLLEGVVPWAAIVSYLNHHASSKSITSHVLRKEFPRPDGDVIGRPLPEDFVLRGQISMEGYFPTTWFSDADVDDEERVMELPSMTAPRTERILWLGHYISTYNRWMTFNGISKKFEETQYVRDMPSPEMSATVDPSVVSTETDTLVTDSMDEEKTTVDETGIADEARSSLRTWNRGSEEREQELQSPRESLVSATPVMLKREPTDDVEMKDADSIKQESPERTHASSKPQYRTDFAKTTTSSRSSAPSKNNKYFGAAPRGADPVRILSPADDPTDT